MQDDTVPPPGVDPAAAHRLQEDVFKMAPMPGTMPAGHGAEPAPATVKATANPTSPRPSDASASHEHADEFIGPFRLLEKIGTGGFGNVWRAEQLEPIHREVALKVIKLGMDSEEIIARFAAERQALAMMDHPNIATVLDAGSTREGRPYFAMELVKGVPLTHYCDARKLDVRSRVELFIPVCHAVHHAHQKSILHRDLKPSNILIQEVDGLPQAKVIDFGIAKALGSSPEAAMQGTLLRTQEGMIVGTPQYMSPEQMSFGELDVDTRSDIYTLGIILYELLTGDTPVTQAQIKKAGIDELIRLVCHSEVKRPSSRMLPRSETMEKIADLRHSDPGKLSSALKGDLNWIALKALEKDRDRRYESASALALDLRRYLAGEVVDACPPSQVYRIRKFLERNKGVVAALGTVLATLLIGFGLTFWQMMRAVRAEKESHRRLETAERTRDAAEDLITESIFGMRKKLSAIGKAGLMADMIAATESYYDRLPGELVDSGTERHKGALSLNKAAVAAMDGNAEHEKRCLEAIAFVDDLLKQHPGDALLLEESCMAMIILANFYQDRGDHARLFDISGRLDRRCEEWLKHHPSSAAAVRFQALSHCMGAFVNHRSGGDLMNTFARFQRASQTIHRLRELTGESAEVCEVEGLLFFGNGRLADWVGQRGKSAAAYESSARSFQRATEMGGTVSGILLQELEAGSWRAAGLALRKDAIARGNRQDQERAEALVRRATEINAVIVKLEPHHAEWWRDLSLSHRCLADFASERGDQVEWLRKMEECESGAAEALRLQPSRPLLHIELAKAQSALSGVLLKLKPTETSRPLELIFSSLQNWKKGVELAGMIIESRANHGLNPDISRLGRLAANVMPETALEWYVRVRGIIEPFLGKLQGSNDTDYSYVLTLIGQHHTLRKLRRDSEAEKVFADLCKRPADPALPPDLVKTYATGIQQIIDARADEASKLPEQQRTAALSDLESGYANLRALLESAIRRHAGNVPCLELLGHAWRSEAKRRSLLKQLPEEAAAYAKAAEAYGSANKQDSQATAWQNQGEVLQKLKNHPSALAAFKRASLLRSGLANASADSAVWQKAATSWASVAGTQALTGDLPSAVQASWKTVELQEQALKISPGAPLVRWNLARYRLLLASHLFPSPGIDQGAAVTALAIADVNTLLSNENEANRIREMASLVKKAMEQFQALGHTQVAGELGQLLIALNQRLAILNRAK